MGKDTKAYEQLMHVLDQVLTKVESLHSPFHDFGTGLPIYRNEIHTIQDIGRYPNINLKTLAEHMGVTKGAASQTITKLVRKDMVRKTHAKGNAKEVVLELTDLGWIGFQNHEKFHMDMFDIAREYFGDQIKPKLEMFKTVMTDFKEILSEYEKRKRII